MGGYNDTVGGSANIFERYDIRNNKWETLPDLLENADSVGVVIV